MRTKVAKSWGGREGGRKEGGREEGRKEGGRREGWGLLLDVFS